MEKVWKAVWLVFVKFPSEEQSSPSHRALMENIRNRYYQRNQTFLNIVGLWPFQSSKLVLATRVIVPLFFVTGFVTQILAFYTVELDMLTTLKILSFTMLPLIYCFKYGFFLVAAQRIRELITRIETDWKLFMRPEERSIILTYANYTRVFTIAFASFIYPSAFAGMIWIYLPQLHDFVAPINITRAERLPVVMECFVDQNKYFSFIALYLNSTIGLGATTLIATESCSMLFVQYVCGIFKVAGYLAETLVNESLLKISTYERDSVIRRRIREASFMYWRAIQFSRLYSDAFLPHYGVLMILGTASMSLNLFRLSQALLTAQVEDIVLSILFVISHLFYIFFCNYMGQLVLDHSSELHHRLYCTAWYITSGSSQRLFLLFMSITNKPYQLLLSGIFHFSIEGFASITNLSVSYFMVFYSVVK